MFCYFRSLSVVVSLLFAISLLLLSPVARAQREASDRERREHSRLSVDTVPTVPTEFADLDPETPAPSGFRREYRRRPWEAVTGGVIFAVAYGPALYWGALAMGCTEGRQGDECNTANQAQYLAIPVVGPVATLGLCGNEGWCEPLFITDAVLQLAGVIMLVDGLWEHPYLVKEATALSMPKMTVSAAPLPGGSMVSVVGVF